MSEAPLVMGRRQVLVRIGLSLCALLVVGMAVVAVFALAFHLTDDDLSAPPADNAGRRAPAIIDSASILSGDSSSVIVPKVRRAVSLRKRVSVIAAYGPCGCPSPALRSGWKRGAPRS